MLINTILRKHATMFLRNLGMLVMTIGICFLVCYATKDNAFVTYEQTKVVVFAYTMSLVWIGLFDSLPIYNDQKLYVEADFDNNAYSPLEYLVSVMIIETILGIMQALIASTVFFYYFGEDCHLQNLVTPSGRIDFLITSFLIIFSGICMGFLIGVFFEAKYSLILIPLFLILQMLFSKCIFDLPERCEQISIIVISRFGAGSIGSLVDLNSYPLKINMESAIQLPQPFQEIYRPEGSYIASNWCSLLILSVVPLMIAWLVLEFRANRMRR